MLLRIDDNESNYSHLTQLTISVLKGRHVDTCKKEELKIIVNTLKHISHFNEIYDDLGDKGLLRIASIVNLKIFKKGECLVDLNEDFKNFYILLKGEVEEHKIDQNCNFNIFRIFKDKDCFGDSELINKTSNFSKFISTQFSYLLYINHTDFFYVLSQIEDDRKDCFISYLKQYDIFKDYPKREFFSIYRVASKKVFKKNDIIYNEGSPIDGIYFVKRGEFIIKKSNESSKNKKLKTEILYQEKELFIKSMAQKMNVNYDSINKHINNKDLNLNNKEMLLDIPSNFDVNYF